jgi:hypothetical protein
VSSACPHATAAVYICPRCLIRGIDTPEKMRKDKKIDNKAAKLAAKVDKFKVWLDATWIQESDENGVLSRIECIKTGKVYTRAFPYTKDQAIAYFGRMAEVYRKKHPVTV